MSAEKKSANPVEVANPTETVKAEEPAPVASAPTAAPAAPVAPAAPAAPTEKKPMDPKKKKNIIIWSCVGGGVVIAAIVAIVLVIVLTKVDYKESYDIAKKLSDPMSSFYFDYGDCKYLLSNVDSSWSPTPSSFSSDVKDCKTAISTETIDLVKQLGESSGVSRDSDVKTIYDKFYSEYSKAIADVDGETAGKLDIYDSWHKFIYDADGFYFTSATQSKIDETANNAINSGNDTLKAFGEEWKTKATEVFKAYEAYDDATTNYSSLYSDYTTKKKNLENWYDEKVPKVSELLPLKFEGDKSAIDSAWDDLVAIISRKQGEKTVEDIMNGSSVEDILNEYLK